MTLDNYQNSIRDLQTNLLNYAFILTSDRRNAYQLLNDTTAAVLSRRNDFTGEEPLKEWIMAKMYAIFIKKYPRIVHKVKVGQPAGIRYQMQKSVDYSAEAGCEWLIEEPRVSQAICAITDKEECLWVKLFVKGYTLNEIATRRSRALSRIKERVSHAMHSILSQLH